VLLVDDDASIRRFVAMALDTLDIELVACGSVAEALEALRRQGPVRLILTDLMMPGENGLVLLQRLAEEPALRGGARVAVFSAGLHGVRAELARHDIWCQLSKPVSAVELEARVREAVAAEGASAYPAERVPARTGPDGDGLDAAAPGAIDAHFAGNRELFLAFREGCLSQFEADIVRGNENLRRADLPALRHLAHSLKSVLTLLGEDELSGVARQLEDSAARADAGLCAGLWPRLNRGLARLIADSARL
jgi:CheY-like chemotaxis protein/HPt (histidine-containing phosphotransfer) domain-containing protein